MRSTHMVSLEQKSSSKQNLTSVTLATALTACKKIVLGKLQGGFLDARHF